MSHEHQHASSGEAIAVAIGRAVPTASARVTLIRPPVVVLRKSLSYVGPMPSIGLAYVAEAMRAAGHGVQVIDAAGEALDQLHDFEAPSGSMRRIGLSPDEVVDRITAGVQVV